MWPSNVKKQTNPKQNKNNNNTYLPNTHAHAHTRAHARTYTHVGMVCFTDNIIRESQYQLQEAI